MKIFILLLTVFAILSVSLADTKKKRKRRAESEKPHDVPSHLYCESCKAIALEMVKAIGESKKEVDIYDSISNICDQKRLAIYEYPPPDMIKGCFAFISRHEDDTINFFLKRSDNENVTDKLCLEVTKACVDAGEKPASAPTVEINGVKYPVGADGSIKMDNMNFGGDDL